MGNNNTRNADIEFKVSANGKSGEERHVLILIIRLYYQQYNSKCLVQKKYTYYSIFF